MHNMLAEWEHAPCADDGFDGAVCSMIYDMMIGDIEARLPMASVFGRAMRLRDTAREEVLATSMETPSPPVVVDLMESPSGTPIKSEHTLVEMVAILSKELGLKGLTVKEVVLEAAAQLGIDHTDTALTDCAAACMQAL